MSIETIQLTNHWHVRSGGVGTFYRRTLEAAGRATAEALDSMRLTDGFFDLYDHLHALVLKGASQPDLEPSSYSTPGDRWGNETS